MSKTVDKSTGPMYHFYPAVAAVVTVRTEDRANAMACAWHSALSREPPLYGILISPERFSHGLILEAKEFGVNFLPFEKAEIIAGVGRNSGRELDKFRAFTISVEEPLVTSAPILRDAYAAYECRLVDHHHYGDHTLFVGEIVMVHVLGGAFTGEGVPDLSRVRPAMYLGADWYIYPAVAKPVRLPGILPRKAEPHLA